MKKLFFDIDRDGFYGTYYENPKGANCAVIGLFGDGVVDIPMFKACGFSVAMANGNDEVKNAVDYVTDDVDQDGLYKAFEYLKLI